MKERLPTVKFILENRYLKANGTFAVKMRVTWKRKQKYYATGIDLTKEDFDKVMGERPRDRHKTTRQELEALEARAWKVINEMPIFTYDKFEAELLNRRPAGVNSILLREAFNTKIRALISEDRLSTAQGYEFARNSLLATRPDLTFYDVTPDFLRKYEKRMTDNGTSIATVGIYCRYLRSLFNEAVESGLIPAELYPFGKVKTKYQIPTKRNAPAPLSQAEVSKIFQYKPKSEAEARARDLWLFSFLLNGANMRDVANLKWLNVDRNAGKITFYRAKTRNTARNQKPIQVVLTPLMLEIINNHGNPPGKPTDYVFPIFTEGMTAGERQKANESTRQGLRKHMANIAAALGIEGKQIHNYVARDTFAKAQRLAGETGDAIGEALGHENRSTTDTYLDAFEDDVKTRLAENAVRYLDGEK
ncbi:MAG: site-specific integrase [Saprospiraceae bacterium]|nr:site-specific integrase [Saprospiraceae bacterium]